MNAKLQALATLQNWIREAYKTRRNKDKNEERSSRLNLSDRFSFVLIGLLALFSFDKKWRESCPQRFKAWDTLPVSSQEGWKRFWIILLGTPILFITISLGEQIIKPKIQSQTGSEQTQTEEECPLSFSPTGLYCLIIESELLQLAETFSIVVAAWIFILDRQDRREQARREDWSLIDGARDSETSGARFSAIERLHQERVSLRGLDAEGADLYGINLEGANLERSNLQRADLQEANLTGTNLKKANLKASNLEKTKLEKADLWFADLRGANLKEANLKDSLLRAAKLHRATLRKANLEGAYLRGSRFYDVDFRDANLQGADLAGAEFGRAKNLTLNQIKGAKSWERARFTEDILPENSDLPRKQPISPDINQQTKSLKLLRELREIENLIDEISQKRVLPGEEFYSYLRENSFEIPEVNTLNDLVSELEDLHESKKKELDDLREDLKQNLVEIKKTAETKERE